ncbi:MAG: flagellar motor protein MotB [Planctomycetaceae bacterium]
MSRKKKAPPSGPSNAYLMSFGDTMTALLAFFIVLNSLAKEQTGANLHAGTGSFVSAVSSLGLPGNLSTEHSRKAVQFEEPSPYYMDTAREGEEDNSLRILDREKEEFQRLLNELERFYEVDSLPSTRASVVFDVFQKLKPGDKPLSTNSRRMLNRTRPMLSRPNYEIEVVVWATTPSKSAWLRAFNSAKKIVKQYSREVRLSADMKKRLRPVARAWLFSDEKRPVMSVVVINRSKD